VSYHAHALPFPSLLPHEFWHSYIRELAAANSAVQHYSISQLINSRQVDFPGKPQLTCSLQIPDKCKIFCTARHHSWCYLQESLNGSHPFVSHWLPKEWMSYSFNITVKQIGRFMLIGALLDSAIFEHDWSQVPCPSWPCTSVQTYDTLYALWKWQILVALSIGHQETALSPLDVEKGAPPLPSSLPQFGSATSGSKCEIHTAYVITWHWYW